MSENTHTPGPWRVGRAGPNLCPTVGTETGLMVAMVTHGEGHPTEANAKLIATAPELLAALQELVASEWEYMDDGDLQHELAQGNEMVRPYIVARAVIKKATT